MTEKEIENEILEYLYNLPSANFWKVNTGGVYDPARRAFRKRQSKFKTKGIPDIIGFYHGEFFAFEVKTPKTKTRATPEQKDFIFQANEVKARAFIVWDQEQVHKILREYYLIEKMGKSIEEVDELFRGI